MYLYPIEYCGELSREMSAAGVEELAALLLAVSERDFSKVRFLTGSAVAAFSSFLSEARISLGLSIPEDWPQDGPGVESLAILAAYGHIAQESLQTWGDDSRPGVALLRSLGGNGAIVEDRLSALGELVGLFRNQPLGFAGAKLSTRFDDREIVALEALQFDPYEGY